MVRHNSGNAQPNENGNYNNKSNFYRRKGRQNRDHDGYKYQQNQFPQLPRKPNPSSSEKSDDEIPAENEPQALEVVDNQSPSLQNPPQLNLVWQGLPPNYQMAPDQLYVLSGEFRTSKGLLS